VFANKSSSFNFFHNFYMQDCPIDDYVQLNPPSAPPLPGSGNEVFVLASDGTYIQLLDYVY
jgi:hypothetical protein